MFYYVTYDSPKSYNISELHNSSMLYNRSVFQYYIVHKSNNIQFMVSQISLNYLNGASLQDNSLLIYTLYTSSVQDLHHPLRFLLQRQSYAFYQGNTLELSISYDELLSPCEVGFNLLVSSNTLFTFLNLELFMSL